FVQSTAHENHAERGGGGYDQTQDSHPCKLLIISLSSRILIVKRIVQRIAIKRRNVYLGRYILALFVLG
ncbi:MAG: hypothetical protein ACRD7E_13640, partial [Bryobacteraceae bacterium]